MTGESLGLVLWLYIVVMFFPTDSTSRMLTSAAMTALGRLGPYGCLASMVISEVAALLGWYAAGITALVFIGCKPVTFIMAVLRITKMVVAGLVGRFVRWISLPIEFWRHQDGTPFRERNFEPYESESDEDRTDTPVQDTEFNLRNAGYHSGQGRNATWLMVVLFSMVLPFKFSATSSGINVNTLPVIHKVNEPVGDEKWGKIRKHSAFLVSPGPAKHDREAPVNGEVCYIKAHVWLSIDMTVGHGYVHRGNLITSSHVCPRDTIQVGSNTWHLVGRDPLRDLAIFGSERRKESIELEPMEIGDWVYSVGYEGNSWLGKKPVLYKTVVERVDDGVIFTQVPKTSPGHSGLPVFAMVNGTFKLAGVTGKYTWTSNVYEMQHVPNHNTIGSKRTILSGSVGESAFAEDLVKSSAYGLLINKEDHLGRRGMFTITGGHCGSGKTRKIIGKHLLQYHDSFQKIYVAGPTRVVAREIYDALKGETRLPLISLNTSDAVPKVEKIRGCKIEILSHDALFTRLESHQVNLRKTLIIVDEYHVANATTIAMMKLLLYLTRITPIQVIGLSATTADELHRRTNYPVVREVHPDEKSVQDWIDQHPNTKGVIIVPSGGQAGKYAGKREYILLTRETFNTNFKKAKEMKQGIIVATNIVECGANLNLDWVWDSGQEKHPVLDPDYFDVSMMTLRETEASEVQRHGRVGRQRAGVVHTVGFHPIDRRFFQHNSALLANTIVLLRGESTLYRQQVYGEEEDWFDTPTAQRVARDAKKLNDYGTLRRSKLAPYTAMRLILAGYTPSLDGYLKWAGESTRRTQCDRCPEMADFIDERLHVRKPKKKRGSFGIGSLFTRVLGGTNAPRNQESDDEPPVSGYNSLLPTTVEGGRIQDAPNYVRETMETVFRKGARIAQEAWAEETWLPMCCFILGVVLIFMTLTMDKVWKKVTSMFFMLVTIMYIVGTWYAVYFELVKDFKWPMLFVIGQAVILIGLIVHQNWRDSYGHNSAVGYLSAFGTAAAVVASGVDITAARILEYDWKLIEKRGVTFPCQGLMASAMAVVKIVSTRKYNQVKYRLHEERSRDPLGWGVAGLSGTLTMLTGLTPLISSLSYGNVDEILAYFVATMVMATIGYILAQGQVARWLAMSDSLSRAETQSMTAAIDETGELADVDEQWKTLYAISFFLCLCGLQAGCNLWVPLGAVVFHGLTTLGMISGFYHMPILSHPLFPSVFMAIAARDFLTFGFIAANVVVDYGNAYNKELKKHGTNSLLGSSWGRSNKRPDEVEYLRYLAPMERFKRRLFTMTEEQFNAFRDQKVVRTCLERGVVGKGYYKMDWFIQQGFKPHGRALELGGGTGGFTQRLFRNDQVGHVITLVFSETEKGEASRHNRFKLFEMEGERQYAEKHTLLVGDIHADEVKNSKSGLKVKLEELKEISGIISDIGESKNTLDGQMDYSRKKRRRFEDLLYELGSHKKKDFYIVYKELCPWDKQFVEFCSRHGLNIIRYPGASLASTEVYAIRNGRKTALGKEPLKEIERMLRTF